MMKQKEEMQKVYAKYGSSPTGGCLPTLIQFPIIMALYYVIRGVNIIFLRSQEMHNLNQTYS